MIKSILISTFILLCATIIESSILSNISFLLVVPDLVLICSLYFSLLNGKTIGETTGFISGLFLDLIIVCIELLLDMLQESFQISSLYLAF